MPDNTRNAEIFMKINTSLGQVNNTIQVIKALQGHREELIQSVPAPTKKSEFIGRKPRSPITG